MVKQAAPSKGRLATFFILHFPLSPMRTLILFFAALCSIGFWNACTPPPPANDSADSTTLRLGLLPTIDCLPFYYADSTGIFDSLSLDVSLVTFSAAMDADTALQNGTIDALATDLVKLSRRTPPCDSLHVVMTGTLNLWLVTASNARLLKAESLKDKIIGTTRHSAVHYFFDRLTEKAGLQPIDVNKPQINDISVRASMLVQNQYDAAILPEPHASEAVARGAKRIMSSADLHLGPLLCVLLADSLSEDKAKEAQRLRDAYDLAVAAMNADTLLRPMHYLPRPHRPYLPDSLFRYHPMRPSTPYHDSLLNDIRKWNALKP